MRTLVCTGPGHFVYGAASEPALQKGNAILKIRRIGICGTDLHAYEGTQPYFEFPRILGHELSGELIAFDEAPGFRIGEPVTFIPYFSCGHCIACRMGKPNCCSSIKVCGVHQDGGMVEYLSVPSSSLVHGDGLNYDQLAMVEPMAIGAHGVRRAAVKEDEFVLVVGAGPIGMGAMEFSRLSGGKVIALDINESRLLFCKEKLRLPYALNALLPDLKERLLEITGGDMPTVVIDASGSLNAINRSFDYMAHGGRFVLIGLQRGEIHFSHPEFHKKESSLMSSRNATREDFEYVVTSMKSKAIDPTVYITHRILFGKIKDEFPAWLDQSNGIIKVMAEMD